MSILEIINPIVFFLLIVILAVQFAVIFILWQKTKSKKRRSVTAHKPKDEKVYLTLFQKSFDPVMLLKDKKFIDCNEATLRIMEMSKDEFLLKHPFELSPEYQPDGKLSKVKADEMLKIAAEAGNHKFEWVLFSNTGKTLVVEITLTAVMIDGHKHIYVVWRDLNEMKRVENELLFAKEQAEESDRLKSAFMESISHEIRTPMNAIMGFSQLMNLKEAKEKDKKQYIYYINKAANSLLLIINNVVDVSSIKAGVFDTYKTELDLNDLFEKVNKFAQSETEFKSIQIDMTTPDSGEKIVMVTDAIRIRKTLYQLLLNSLKFTEYGFIKFGYSKKDNMLEFFVHDSGIGISEEDQKVIFRIFRKGKPNGDKLYAGIGLGLSIAKASVESLGGQIWLTSKQNEGTQVYFKVPFKENSIK